MRTTNEGGTRGYEEGRNHPGTPLGIFPSAHDEAVSKATNQGVQTVTLWDEGGMRALLARRYK
jgi:hypothetical protein